MNTGLSSTTPGRASARTVLLAEDDDELRGLLVRALEKDGITVEAVASGTEALQVLLASDHVRPDVIVSDVRMPGRNGLDVLKTLRRARIDLPVVLITGFGHALDPGELDALGNVVVLEKPFDVDDLRTALMNLSCLRRKLIPAT